MVVNVEGYKMYKVKMKLKYGYIEQKFKTQVEVSNFINKIKLVYPDAKIEEFYHDKD